MSSILDEIVAVKKNEIKILKRDFTLSRFSDYQFFDRENLGFRNTLINQDSLSIIAEVKKASPSKGIIKANFNYLKIAETYMKFGANAISVLTDKTFFMGNINYMNEIALIKTIPVLRKDFIIDEYQIFEAKANGADAILLICEILSQNQINELSNAAFELGLDVLLELHNENQIPKIDFSSNKIIGINNRDLNNFRTNLATTKEISEQIDSDVVIVAESGINSLNDINYLKKTKSNAILIGEYLMKSANISDSLLSLKDECLYEN